MTIDALPTVPSTASPTTFAADMDTFLAALPTFRTQANALSAAMAAVAAGGAVSLQYVFSTTTADADPGAGTLRLDNATQNAATTIRADLAGADGSDLSGVLALLDYSTSTNKGYITLRHKTTPTKWLVFQVASLASPSGYKNVTVTCVASSAASPFANADEILLDFTPTGDKGETGSQGPAGNNGTNGVDGASGAPGNHEVTVHTGNGHGAVNTKIRRFTTAITNVGTAITYADNANNGASFTINEAGIYAIHYSDTHTGDSAYIGLSVNSAALTTNVQSISVANRLAIAKTGFDGATITYAVDVVARTVRLSASDVVRPHTDGTPNSASNLAFFSIRKVANDA